MTGFASASSVAWHNRNTFAAQLVHEQHEQQQAQPAGSKLGSKMSLTIAKSPMQQNFEGKLKQLSFSLQQALQQL